MNPPLSHDLDRVKDTPKAPLVLLQSLRAVAAGMVVCCHLYLWGGKYFPNSNVLPSGTIACESGVDLFFVISGFIMMHITPKAHRSWRDQAIFLFRRFARIYPAYWAVALPLLVIWFWHPKLINNYQGNQVDIPASLLLYPSQIGPVLIVGWTLVCELTYYLIASLIFYFEGLVRLLTIALWLSVILISNVLHPLDYSNPWANTFLYALTIEFISGMILAHLLKMGLFRINPLVAALMVIASLSIIFIAGSWHGTCAGNQARLPRVLMYGLPAFTIVWMVLQMDIQGEWKFLKKLAPVGDRSYCIYLVHVPIIAFVYRVAAHEFHITGRFEVIGVMLMAIAALVIPVECLHRLIEKPSHVYARILTSESGPSKRAGARDAPSS